MPMTYNQLKDLINKMPEEQLKSDVLVHLSKIPRSSGCLVVTDVSINHLDPLDPNNKTILLEC